MNDNGPTVGINQNRHLMKRILIVALVALFAKVLVEILYQYRWYFPPDFDNASFLIGRETTFHGFYRIAFYIHIIASPVALLAGSYLFISGTLGHRPHIHRFVGRFQMLLVLFAVAPSGLAMSLRAHTGPIAGAGFAVLAILTAITVVAAVYCARRRDFSSHRLWALRCFTLLCSPLLLRVMNGAASSFQLESERFYQISAWLSWLAPLLVFEVIARLSIHLSASRPRARITVTVQRKPHANPTQS